MKIVHVTKYFSGAGGIESYTRFVSKAAVAEGHEVAVVCSTGNKKYSERYEDKIKIVGLPENASLMNAPITQSMIGVLKKLGPDVIHLHMPNPWAEMNIFLYKMLNPGTRLVATYHSDVISYSPLMKLFSIARFAYLIPSMNVLCDKIIATSENYVRGSLLLTLARRKVKVIPLGVDIKKFAPSNNKNRIFTFLFVGRLIPYKGLEKLIRACNILKLSGKKFVLKIVGSGKLYSSLRKEVSSLGLNAHVKFCTSVSDKELPKMYRGCDVFVLPSVYKSEAFGLAQLEAMSSGKPVVSTKIRGSGVSFVNRDGVTGIVVRPGDEIALANAMMNLMDNNKLRADMGLNARNRAVKLFDQEKISRRIMEIYGR